MFEDRYGMPVTTTSAAAFAHYAEALDLALGSCGGARPLLELALELDPGFALAWALLGLQLRGDGDLPGGTALVERAVALADSVTERERGQLAMLDAFCHGRFPAAQALADAHLTTWPGDAVVMMQVHFVFNLLSAEPDRRAKHDALAQRVLTAFPDDWYFLGEAAFTAAEMERYDESLELATRSFAGNAANADAAHATAHVYLETAELDTGTSWLRTWLETWAAPSAFACHLTWHRELFGVAADDAGTVDVDALVAFLDRSVGVLTDGASLLWRLRLGGAVELPWRTLADLPSAPGFSHSNYHRAFVLAGLGDLDALEEWSAQVGAKAARGHPSAAICATVCDAISLHAQGDFEACAKQLGAVEDDFVVLGGSRAQLEVLEDTLIDALAKSSDRSPGAVARLDARLARRETPRDRAWRNRLRERV